MKIYICLFSLLFINSCSLNNMAMTQSSMERNKCFNYCQNQNSHIEVFEEPNTCRCYNGK